MNKTLSHIFTRPSLFLKVLMCWRNKSFSFVVCIKKDCASYFFFSNPSSEYLRVLFTGGG